MDRPRVAALLLVGLMLAAGFSGVADAASWQPKAGEWTTLRGDAARQASTPLQGAFPAANLADLRVKWTHTGDIPFWLPPTVADLDRDGVPEVIGPEQDIQVEPGPPPTISFNSGFQVLNGATGELKWKYGPNAGNLMWVGPSLGDVNGDGKAEVVFFDGQPLTGSFATNRLYAYSATGTKLWEFGDANWPAGKVPNVISSTVVADVDGEAAFDEAIVNVLFAKITSSIQGQTLDIQATEPEYRVLAVNGEGSPAASWSINHPNGSSSSPAVADLDGDGKRDVVFGSGMQRGVILDFTTVRITLSDDFEDKQLLAYAGGASPQQLWSFNTAPVDAGEIASAPSIADVNGDGKPDVVMPLARRASTGRGNVTVIDNGGTQLWKSNFNAGTSRPAAVGDLNGDGKPDVVVQVEGGSEGNRLLAYRHDGALLWRSLTSSFKNGAPAIGDLTGDGRPEVATMQGATSTLPSRLMVFNGQTGALMWVKDIDADDNLGGPVIADVDGDDDGRAEIVVNVGSFLDSPFLGHSILQALEPELPDLRLTDLAFSGADHVVGEPETVSAKLTNVGSRTATNALVRFLDGTEVVREQTLTLAPGASQTLSLDWTPAHGGARSLQLLVDPGKAIAEWKENDNALARDLFVRSADFAFAASDPVFSDGNPSTGDTVTVSATLRNLGGKAASDVVVRFLDDGVAFATATVASLPAGASQAVSAPLLVEGERLHTVALVADPDDLFAEEDEANNRAEATLRVRFLAPDLVLGAADVRFADANPDEFDTLVADVTVHNQGSAGRGATDVLVRLLDGGATVAEAVLPSIASGGSAVARLEYAIAGVGQRALAFVADPAGTVTELNETNNGVARLVVVGKLAPSVTMSKPVYGLQEAANGVAHVQFRSTGNPLAGHALSIPVEYVARLPGLGSEAQQLLDSAAAVLAQVNAEGSDHVRVCAGATCVDTTVTSALDAARTLGGGAGVPAEVRWRLFTIDATTNLRGDAPFEVPLSALGAAQSLRGFLGASGCVSGLDDAFAALGQASCQGAASTIPALPAVGNLPGEYRATAVVDWFGFVFAGAADYAHASA